MYSNLFKQNSIIYVKYVITCIVRPEISYNHKLLCQSAIPIKTVVTLRIFYKLINNSLAV